MDVPFVARAADLGVCVFACFEETVMCLASSFFLSLATDCWKACGFLLSDVVDECLFLTLHRLS